MVNKYFVKSVAASLVLSFSASQAFADDVEVLHWWTSGGEAAAVGVLKDDLAGKGIGWKDMPIAGGGGDAAMTTLKARVTAGNAPTAVQMLGYAIQDWGDQGKLANLNDLAASEGWDSVVPSALQAFSKHNGDWVAAPVNVHSTNWVWISKSALDATGGNAPTTWEELVSVLDAMKANGITPLAHGGQAWQDATIFDGVALSLGNGFYKSALIDLNEDALGGPLMVEAFNRMATLRSYVDDNFSGRDWNLASAMVINGEAGMQMMGDWAKGEFKVAGKSVGTDYVCTAAPGTSGAHTFNIDSFAFFAQSDAASTEAQNIMAAEILGTDFQTVFNLNKGSIPARLGVSRAEFDTCAHDSMDAFVSASASGSLVPSFAHGMAMSSAVGGAVTDSATNFFNSDQSAADGVAQLVASIKAAM